MYTLLTTYPQIGSGNVGDKLIEQAIHKILLREKKTDQFLTVFREHDLTEHLDEINCTKAVLMPGFPIRDLPMYPGVYKLVEDLSKIKVPLIPIGANWNVFPGDIHDRRNVGYSIETVQFLQAIGEQVEQFSCREYHVCRVLRKHGLENTVMTGDPAWYDPDLIGTRMKRPEQVRKLVYTPPLSAFFKEQGTQLLTRLSQMFPHAEKYCVFHLSDMKTKPLPEGVKGDNSVAMNQEVAEKNEAIRLCALRNEFKVIEAGHDISKINFYRECDLHVGYECHAHWAFLRQRIPSVLIAEDARGVGFAYTQGIGGFDGFLRSQFPEHSQRPTNTSGYCDSLALYSHAPADLTLADQVEEFLEDEMESRFRKYAWFSEYMDEIYETRMKPFIKSIP